MFWRFNWLMIFVCTFSVSEAQKLDFDNYTIKNGLPQATVNDIDQDDDGYIWFATQVGAARYDGYIFEYYSSANGLPDDFVNCLLIDNRGSVWFGTQGGIAVFDGSEFTIYDKFSGLVDNRVDGMVEDHDGNIWAWTVYGLSVITPDTILSYTREDALTDNSIIDVMVDSKGMVHVATYPAPGLTIFNGPSNYETLPQGEIIRDIIEVNSGEIWYATEGSGIFVTGPDGDRRLGIEHGLSDEVVLSMMQDSQGQIWCGTYEGGLFIYRNGKFEVVQRDILAKPVAEKIYEDKQGRIWVMDFITGVWLYDEGGVKYIVEQSGLVNNDVGDIFEDKYGSIWMATLGGASKYGKGIFEIYDKDYYPAFPNDVRSVFVDSKANVWFGTMGLLFSKQEQGTIILDASSGFPEYAEPFSFAEDKDQKLYIGTNRELLYLDGEKFDTIHLEKSRPRMSFFDLLYTSQDQLWCATDSGVFILSDGSLINILKGNQGLIHPRVNSLLQVDSLVYCATEGGISVFDHKGHHIRNYSENDGLGSATCYDMACDSNGNIWIATNSSGISMIPKNQQDSVSIIDISDGLISNTIYFVEFADSVSLWIGTNRGINVLNIENGEISYYADEEGFYPLETHERAVSRGLEGELWIGSVEGLVHYNPRYDQDNNLPPDLILFPPLVEGEIYSNFDNRNKSDEEDFPGNPSFQYSKNSVTFNYTAIHTTKPSQNRFSYILEGFDKEWSDLVEYRSVPYDRLPNGNYVFRVKAYNPDGVEVENEASFAFSINPPFWKTIWFILLAVFAGISLVYSIILYRERQLIKEKRILETKVKERTREIEDQKVEIEAQRDEISEQKSYVEQQRDKISTQNKDITDSIQYASRIQKAVLPGKRMLEQVLPEHFILFKPRDIVSGDFFWVEQKDEQVVVCAADCTGHGVPGAFMSMLGLTFLNEIVNKDGILKASEILNKLRAYIIKSMSHRHEDNHQARDGMDVALVVIDRQLNMLEYAGAYNPLVIMRKGEMIEIKGDKMPVGKHVGEEGPFTNHKLQLESNDMIYLFSDGFPDQFGGENDSKYKAKPFKRFLNSISSEPVNDQANMLEKELKTWMGNTEQLDDILVMGIRYLK